MEQAITTDPLPAEADRTEKMRMYSVFGNIVYSDLLGNYPFCRSFGFSNDEGAVRYAEGILADELSCEGVADIVDVTLSEHRWLQRPARISQAGVTPPLVEHVEHRVATLGPDHQFTLHR